MRILHTSDWHLGRSLGGYSRIDEQRFIIHEIADIADERQVDFVIISGDVFDTPNPSAAAEELFYEAMSRLTGMGQRPVLVLGGNHDGQTRITAPSPMITRLGAILAGGPGDAAQEGDYGGFAIENADPGCFELVVNGERAVVLTMPYPSEGALDEMLGQEASLKLSYSEKIGEIFANLSGRYRPDTINLAAGHFYVTGGETSLSERDVSLGGCYAVSADVLPPAQYIALGHLHRPQRVNAPHCRHVYYSGSPLQYSKSEASHGKCVFMADIRPNREPAVLKVMLDNPKPVRLWKVTGAEEAERVCTAHSDEQCWVFLEVETDRPLNPGEVRRIRRAKSDIVEIFPVLTTPGEPGFSQEQEERTVLEDFEAFYTAKRGVPPGEELKALFAELFQESRETLKG